MEEQNPGTNTDVVRISDDDRQAVVEQLGRAVGEGRLDLTTYSERAGSAYRATSRGDLMTLVADLVGSDEPGPSTPGHVESMTAVFGTEKRRGPWSVPQHVVARAALGSCRIDLREARLQHAVTTVDATAVCGTVKITVPPGVDVRLSGSAILGSKSSAFAGRVLPGAPVLNVICKARLGSVKVRPRSR